MTKLNSIPRSADVLSLSPWTVRSYIRQGKLHPVRIGRRVLLSDAELERFIRECSEQGNKSSEEVQHVG